MSVNISYQITVDDGARRRADDAVRRGLALQSSDLPGALGAFQEALSLAPTHGAAHAHRAAVLAALGRPDEAIRAFGDSLRVAPLSVAVFVDLAYLLIRLSRFADALTVFSAALKVSPCNTDALRGRAQCLMVVGQVEEACAAYRELLNVAPGFDYMMGEWFHAQMHCCDWRDFEKIRADINQRVQRGERTDAPGTFHCHSESLADVLICARTFAADVCSGTVPRFAHHRTTASRRIRVAYVSADFHAHATAYLTAGLFECHDRDRFETHAISMGPDDGSEMRSRLRRAFDRFSDVRAHSDEQVAQLIHDLDIDIAVDLKGHTLGARPRIFAMRPAPVQVSFLGYPGTLGMDFIDYIVADKHIIGPEDQRYYTENVIYLPGCYQVNDAARVAAPRPGRRESGLPAEGFVFCCFNACYKITPQVFATWMEILKAVPQSVLWLLQGSDAAVRNLRSEACRRGVDPNRILFASRLPAEQHWARIELADLCLDTLPCNAHTTASDCLWSGVPVVTAAGATFVSRVATSLLNDVGLGHLSVKSLEEYAQLAIRIASSPVELHELKDLLRRARTTATLFDTAGYSRHLEQAYAEIWGRHSRGEPAGPLYI